MTDKPDLGAAYALQTSEDARQLYADWAESYEQSFAEAQGYVLHRAVAAAFVQAGGRGPVLDIGAGTGLCGAALHAHGIKLVDGTDISADMLVKADEKQIYARLFAADILAGLDVVDGFYSGIVSSGTFTNGHVGPEALREVLRLLAPGGLAVISINAQHFTARGFEAELTALEPLCRSIALPQCRIYAEGSPGPHADDRAILAHFVKD